MESSSQASDSGEKVNSVEEKPVNPMEVFSKQLEDIINTFGSASSLLEEKISSLEKDEENLEEETTDANTVVSSNSETEQTASGILEGLSKEASPLLQSLKTLMSPEEKVEMVLSKYGELLKEQKTEQVQLKMLQKRQGLLVKQRDQLQLEHSRGILARSRLEILCRDLYGHTKTLKEEMLLKCQEDERKRAEIHSQFQGTVLDIQAQIEQHSNCNNKLSQENSDLASKLNSILHKYERREETLEKIFRQRDLQQELSDAKLEEANLRLKEAEEKHKREKEYLLKEAIDKTKKCFTMKEQELQMKKQLLTHAAEWKLQVKELKEQNTVMQAQLVLYSQKFDEFQATLAKSNDVYAVFKQDMENMTKKMAKLEKEGNMWKIRFENCNKALTEMINERSEKGKEMALFTVKIDKLQTLCRALQEERKILYDKIKEIRLQATSASAPIADITEEEIPDLAQLSVLEPERNPALTAEMEKLWKEQARLKEFADLLMASTSKDMDSSNSDEELSEPKQTAQLTPLVPVPSKAVQSNQQEEEPTKSEPPNEEPLKAELPKEEPPKAEPPKAEPPKVESPKEEPPKAEPPKEEPPKAEPPKAEPPKEEPPKAEPPKVEPPKAEPPKAEPPKEEPPKAEPPKEEPPKAEPPKEEPPKAEPPKAEPPKEEPPKAEPPKEEPPKAEPPKEEPPKAEPPKKEPPKAELLKVELPKAEPPNAESHKEKFAKVPKKNVAKVEPIQQNTHPQKSNKPNSVEQKEPQPKEVKTVRAQAEAPQVNSSKNELHPEQDPKTESTKEALVAEAEPIKSEPPEASTAGAAKPQNCKCSESKASANKAHSKKPSSSKKKAAAKATKKS